MNGIITGSRDFDDDEVIDDMMWSIFGDRLGAGGVLTIFHGDCPTGADAIADRILREWKRQGFKINIFPCPADWNRLGKVAGPIRNSEMCSYLTALEGPNYVLAFYKGRYSKGTQDMVDLGRAAGVDTIVYYRA